MHINSYPPFPVPAEGTPGAMGGGGAMGVSMETILTALDLG